jgi:signal transduction histidine kinase
VTKAIRAVNPVRSLAAQSRRQLLYLAMALFIGLIALVSSFSVYQIDQAGKNYMRLDAIKLEQAIKNNPDYILPQQEDFSAYRKWEDIPQGVRQLFSAGKIQPSDPLEIERVNRTGVREYGYLLYSNRHQSGGLYLLEFEEADKIEALAEAIFKRTLIDASLITGLFILVLFFVISWLFKRALRPLALLVEWSNQVKQNPDNKINAQFSISELNEIAEHLLSTLQQVREYNEREQQFLRHASHEFRTPLAIIQASLDTLMVRIAPEDPNYRSLLRAGRASANMMLLSEALLWLARQHARPIGKSVVQSGALCRELFVDMQYLIENKNIQVSMDDQAGSIRIEKDLFRIVLANLIRNAFQNTASGTVAIAITDDSFAISNPVDTEDLTETARFGLGLQLVERIAAKLDWQFDFSLDRHSARVVLRWNLSSVPVSPQSS